jgi:hypothetical protein
MGNTRKFFLLEALELMGQDEDVPDFEKLVEMSALLHLCHSILSCDELLGYLNKAHIKSMAEASDHVSIWNGAGLVEVTDFSNCRLYDSAKFAEGQELKDTVGMQELKFSAMEFASTQDFLD